MTRNDLQAIRDHAEKVEAWPTSDIEGWVTLDDIEWADINALVVEVRRLRDVLQRIVMLGGATGRIAQEQLWSDKEREQWALQRRAERMANGA